MTTHASDTQNATHKCPYCGWPFAPTARHEAERVLPYCSLGCRRLSLEKHVAFESRNCEYRDTRDHGIYPPDHNPADVVEALADAEPEEHQALRRFMAEWIKLHSVARDYIALKLLGIPLWTVGELRRVTKQAVSKAILGAARDHHAVALLLGVDPAPLSTKAVGDNTTLFDLDTVNKKETRKR